MSEVKVLVIGGCGFIGYHVVKALLAEKNPTFSVHVMSRNINKNQVPKVEYHTGDFTSEIDVQSILAVVQPVIIFHVASPVPSGNGSSDKFYFDTNVEGTKTLLRVAAGCSSVKAFVYTSSSGVLKGDSYDMGDETWPLKTLQTRNSNAYATSKAIADQLVRDHNEKPFLTATLRVCAVYGERDSQIIPAMMKLMKEGKHRIQIGDNTAKSDRTSGENAALAHVLAAKALLAKFNDPTGNRPKVDGEAFFITDGRPIPTWDFARMVWRAAGDHTPPEQIRVIPARFILNLASLTEWMYWIFTLGYKRPLTFRRMLIETTCVERTFSIEKAKERLGYRPMDNMEDTIKRGVLYVRQYEAEEELKRKQRLRDGDGGS
jgi:sterol-4alpha-carboxylate 3-dehydrogenase (decarboxylating)